MSNPKPIKKTYANNGDAPKFMNIGFGNVITLNRVVAIISPESAPIKRLIQVSKENSMLIDATCGRKTRAVIIMDSQHVILSAMLPETVANRMIVSKGETFEDT